MKKFLIAAFLLCVSNSVIAVPTLNIDMSSGQLLGASGVIVNGTSYDVSFVDGTCVGLFDGCDQQSDFDFVTQIDAGAAAQALLDQVLVGMYDTDPSLTNGIDPGVGVSRIEIPYALDPFIPDVLVLTEFARNYDPTVFPTLTDSVGEDDVARDADTGDLSSIVYALFSPGEAVTIPEPNVVLLFGAGLLGLGFSRRKRKNITAFKSPDTLLVSGRADKQSLNWFRY